MTTVSEASVTINLRAAPRQRDLIDRAASASGKTRTEFMLEAATRAAQDILLDQRLLVVSAEDFERFTALLDAPPEPSAALRDLLTRPTPWET